VIDWLLYHLYNRSIADFVRKLMLISAGEYDEEVADQIKLKQELILRSLVDKLGFDSSEFDN
jgi:hypothetical protein